MTIYEFADVINSDLKFTYYANQGSRFTVQFERGEIKEDQHDCILSGSYGNGTTPELALDDYVRQIKGKVLVLNAYMPGRKEYTIPKTLEAK